MGNTARISISQCSEAGAKDVNEDSFGVLIPDEPLLTIKGIAMVVADGMSGSNAAKEASESCVKSFLTDYYSTPDSWSVKSSAHNILTALNRWLYGQGYAQHGSNRGMVSTLSALVLKSGIAHVFHVGDTRITRFREDVVEPITNDHRVPGRGDKDYLGRAMGIDLNVEIDYQTILVEAGDIFIFTTDGIHDFVSSSFISKRFRMRGENLNAIARDIVDEALSNDSPDNVTCQIVRIDDVGHEDIDTHTRKLSELPFPPELSSGMVLDGFEIIRDLHVSSRSQVYLATSPHQGVKVAIKTPSVNYVDDPAYLDHFQREEWAAKRINSPYVVKIHDESRPKTFLYYVMEYVEGQTLRQWMRDNPDRELAAIRDILGQVAKGLRAFHRKEMLHQDLKPENIIIDINGTIKIIDFGSVKIAGIEEISSPIMDVEHPGTRSYSAPEFVSEDEGGKAGTKYSDRYSIGVIAYEMLTGKLPYGDGFANHRSLRKLQYKPARRYNPKIPDWIDGALAKSVHLVPAQRYDSLSAFLEDLSNPNPKFTYQDVPLIERDPKNFWKFVAFALLAANLFLLNLLFA
ncbi:bifunctional protein-serine/threonine kinase/phosphatase [Sneathiella marina]|uniref:Bifunctional protein-serine/threonine kinase/phosphatase n=1 Tax=Sneathiella marina TaxID=2950108 RepID=A0ABY4W4A8_9PROT|nr:bifunctional protein-serine/threonine kinase/phosphatase [Sneathiella marina]USG62031.1 bifunctional protein-serine/threonine kinase/phosphatase [Sneathiella marina]